MSVNKYTLFAKKLQGLLSIGTLSGGLLNSYKHQSISNQCILYNLYRNLGPTAAWIYFADHQLIVFTNHAIVNSPPFNTKGFNSCIKQMTYKNGNKGPLIAICKLPPDSIFLYNEDNSPTFKCFF